MPLRRFAILLSSLFFLVSCGPDLRPGVAEAYASLPEEIDFNFHVKPILSDRCYACHGPDAQNQQADLRLDNAAGAYAALASGEGFAIVPGKPGQSAIIDRINSDDPNRVMPTPESNLSLTDKEIAILTKWVEQGAEYKDHWAFVAPEKPAVPSAGEGWARNEVDRFVAAKLDLEGVNPSPEAGRAYLIRRAFFDLTGLPPSLSEIDHWEQDPEADWYERMVDDLLSRPAYGERMAAYWMDVARFADSEGYLDDFHHELWPYRDWVIKAYNGNLPYDQFVEWQVGGDQMENPTRDQVLATTFNRTHKQNSEGGIISEEFRVEYVADRANTVGTAFMGLTMGCARCHDHKYDPISQKDYFELFSFFNNTVEKGDAIFAFNGTKVVADVPHEMAMNSGPTLPLPSEETEKIYQHIKQMIAEKERQNTASASEIVAPASAPQTAELAKVLSRHTVHHLSFDEQPLRDNHLVWDALERTDGAKGKAALLGEGSTVVDGMASRFEHSDPFTVSFWIKAPKDYADALVLYNSNSKNQGMRGWEARLDSNRLVLKLSHAYPYQSLALRVSDTLVHDEWTHFTWSYDGSGTAKNMRVYRNGRNLQPEILRDHLLRSTQPYTDPKMLMYEHYRGLTVGGRHYDPGFPGGAVDELRVLDVEAGDLLAEYLYCVSSGQSSGGASGRERGCRVGDDEQGLLEFVQLHRSPEQQAEREQLRALRARAIATIDTVREIMVMGDDDQQHRQAYILDRGAYDAPTTPVESSIPEALMDWPEGLPKNRYGLGKWLTHPDNPMTARVAVNQLWYVVFGRGIVESVEDFGNQGSLPSHPDLLDWLAVDFQENGWDVKRLLRLMVTSATYRQSSKVRVDLEERDPDNYWLARAPRYRRDAEMVRDNLLAASGLLQNKRGGPSAFPYQPTGLWAEVNHHSFSPEYAVDPNNQYRRSLYTFWKRNAPTPSMLTFDASLRSECQVRRQRSNTPLQALVLLNDPETLAACRVLAANTLAEAGSAGDATELVFRKLTGRLPTANELEILNQFFEDELNYFHDHPLAAQEFLSTGADETDQSAGAARVAAMARVANTVANSTEGYYKN